eukprot:8046679-Alexandrium_andersonii.AAC.1
MSTLALLSSAREAQGFTACAPRPPCSCARCEAFAAAGPVPGPRAALAAAFALRAASTASTATPRRPSS